MKRVIIDIEEGPATLGQMSIVLAWTETKGCAIQHHMSSSLLDLRKYGYLRIHPDGRSENIMAGQKTE